MTVARPTSRAAKGAQAAKSEIPGGHTFRWLLAWGALLLILMLANRTRLGHAAIYYLLVITLFLLLVTQYKWLVNVLAPFQSIQV